MKKTVIEKYKMLRTVTLLLRVLAWISLLGGILVSIIILIAPETLIQYGLLGDYSSWWLSILVILISAVLYAIIFFAVAELICVFLSIEENTGRLRKILDKK